mmetsp:Transcript_57549/g.171157  ORF Transcript_57549/g.171157 Transcript_57549/m.171157 type:complete len:281 (+) Transcript_57549:365-1207(+)
MPRPGVMSGAMGGGEWRGGGGDGMRGSDLEKSGIAAGGGGGVGGAAGSSGREVRAVQMWYATNGSLAGEDPSVGSITFSSSRSRSRDAAASASSGLGGSDASAGSRDSASPGPRDSSSPGPRDSASPACTAPRMEAMSPCSRWVTECSASARSLWASKTMCTLEPRTSWLNRLEMSRPPICSTKSGAAAAASGSCASIRSSSGTSPELLSGSKWGWRSPEQMSGAAGQPSRDASAAHASICASVDSAPTTIMPRRAPRRSSTMGRSCASGGEGAPAYARK